MNTALTVVTVAWVAITAARMYRSFRDANRRINADLAEIAAIDAEIAELRAIYEPIDYWPVDIDYRAVWPMAAGGFE